MDYEQKMQGELEPEEKEEIPVSTLQARTRTSSAPKHFENVHGTTGAATVAANSTVYIFMTSKNGLADSGATEHDARTLYLVTRPGVLKNLVVISEAAAGAGETFTYMVRQNADVSTLTAEIGGATENEEVDSTHSVSVAIGDRIAVELATSAGAAVTDHAFSFEFEG